MRTCQLICGLFFFVASVQSGHAQPPETKDRSFDACPGTLAKVRDACGCEPREEAAFNYLAQTGLSSDNLRSRLEQCFKLDGTLNVSKLKLQGNAALVGCLTKVEDQYPEYRQTLADLVKTAKDVAPHKMDIWLCCYGKTLGQGDCAPARKPSQGASTTTAPPSARSPDIDQRVESDNAHMRTQDVEAVHHGKAGSGTIRQTIKATNHGVVETGKVQAEVSP